MSQLEADKTDIVLLARALRPDEFTERIDYWRKGGLPGGVAEEMVKRSRSEPMPALDRMDRQLLEALRVYRDCIDDAGMGGVAMRVGRFGELIPLRGFSRSGAKQLRGLDGVSGWVTHDGVLAISGCHVAPLPGTDGTPGPQWLISVSRPAPGVVTRPLRASDDDLRRVVDCFDLPAFDEDNHHPGIARHLWCPHDEQARLACECKVTETTIVEPDGYVWTNDDSEPCRGCAYETLFRYPCPIHSPRG